MRWPQTEVQNLTGQRAEQLAKVASLEEELTRERGAAKELENELAEERQAAAGLRVRPTCMLRRIYMHETI
jgi:predicted phage-related endonuclease